MQLTRKGYPIKFIQTHPVRDTTKHLISYIYKFFSEKTKLHYVVTADFHEHDFIALKFYCKKDRRSPRKYSNVINKGDVSNILITCAKVVPLLLKIYPNASFGFIGARTIDTYSDKIEGYKKNQRYRLYEYHIPQLFGDKTFLHKNFPMASSYALLNKNVKDLDKLEEDIKTMICETYPSLLDVNFSLGSTPNPA